MLESSTKNPQQKQNKNPHKIEKKITKKSSYMRATVIPLHLCN